MSKREDEQARIDFHLLLEEGHVYRRFRTPKEAHGWRAQMRRRARGITKIRTGLAGEDPTLAMAVRMDTRPLTHDEHAELAEAMRRAIDERLDRAGIPRVEE